MANKPLEVEAMFCMHCGGPITHFMAEGEVWIVCDRCKKRFMRGDKVKVILNEGSKVIAEMGSPQIMDEEGEA